jgi:predicted transcriptional regulator
MPQAPARGTKKQWRLRASETPSVFLAECACARGEACPSEVEGRGALVATSDPIELAAEILTAFVANNSVPRPELAALFEGLHAALKRLADGEVALSVIEPPTPAVSIRRSVTPDYLICLDDGRQFKSLRRHLGALGMTPEQYRQKWNLPSDYPTIPWLRRIMRRNGPRSRRPAGSGNCARSPSPPCRQAQTRSRWPGQLPLPRARPRRRRAQRRRRPQRNANPVAHAR